MICILLLLGTVQAQIVFPDEDAAVPAVLPKPVINSPGKHNPDPAKHNERVYFPDDLELRAPTTFTTTTSTTTELSSLELQPLLTSSTTRPPSHNTEPSPIHSIQAGVHSSIIPTECGKSSVGNRVVGGTVSEPGEWPWLAALGRKSRGRFINGCGGSLITARHVLSADHCFATPIKPDIVRLGEYDLKRSDDIPDTQDFSITHRYSTGYNQLTYENDIVILVLDRDVIFTDTIQPVCLPFSERDNNFAGEILVVAGWGKTNYETSSFTDVPLYALVPVVDTRSCAQSYQQGEGRLIKPVVDDRQLCAGDGTKDSCSGDSGGPLQYLSLSDDRYYLVGIVSFGFECANPDYPGVYTRVTTFLDWIMDKVNN